MKKFFWCEVDFPLLSTAADYCCVLGSLLLLSLIYEKKKSIFAATRVYIFASAIAYADLTEFSIFVEAKLATTAQTRYTIFTTIAHDSVELVVWTR